MNAKRIITLLALLAILVLGLKGAPFFNVSSLTYDGSGTDVTELYEDPEEYDVSAPDGIAEVIIKTDLDKTMAVNDVASVVFDYRGFDTLGESFILLTAIAGSFVILNGGRKKKKEGGSEE